MTWLINHKAFNKHLAFLIAETDRDRIEVCPEWQSYSARYQASMKTQFPGSTSLFFNNRNISELSSGAMYPFTVTNFSMEIKEKEKSKVYNVVWLAGACNSSLHMKKHWESLEARDKDHTISNRKAGDNLTIKE